MEGDCAFYSYDVAVCHSKKTFYLKKGQGQWNRPLKGESVGNYFCVQMSQLQHKGVACYHLNIYSHITSYLITFCLANTYLKCIVCICLAVKIRIGQLSIRNSKQSTVHSGLCHLLASPRLNWNFDQEGTKSLTKFLQWKSIKGLYVLCKKRRSNSLDQINEVLS